MFKDLSFLICYRVDCQISSIQHLNKSYHFTHFIFMTKKITWLWLAESKQFYSHSFMHADYPIDRNQRWLFVAANSVHIVTEQQVKTHSKLYKCCCAYLICASHCLLNTWFSHCPDPHWVAYATGGNLSTVGCICDLGYHWWDHSIFTRKENKKITEIQ